MIELATDIAKRAHDGQFRKYDPVPYFVHPERVAKRLARYWDAGVKNNAMLVAAGYLHDVIEDCHPKFKDEIVSRCGIEVFLLVLEVSNPSKNLRLPRDTRKAIDRAYISKASPEARILKLVDRTDNLLDILDAPADFKDIYLAESERLFDCLIGTSDELETEYVAALGKLRATIK